MQRGWYAIGSRLSGLQIFVAMAAAMIRWWLPNLLVAIAFTLSSRSGPQA
jgi:hypothetical protein